MNFRKHVRVARGPLGSAYCCSFCSFASYARKGWPGVGRGWGLAQGSKAHSRTANHIKEKHAKDVVALEDQRLNPYVTEELER